MKHILAILAIAFISIHAQAQNILPSLEAAPTSADLAKQAMTQSLQAGNQSLLMLADSAARSMAGMWKPTRYTTAEALTALGTNAAAVFEQHAAVVGYLWSDAARRQAFISACQRHGVSVSVGENGAPFFADMKAYTVNQDGTISLQ